MEIISVVESNWEELKTIRLASLKESPEAFSASYEAALNRSESEWKARASGREGCNFFIAKIGSQSVGIIGGVHKTGQYQCGYRPTNEGLASLNCLLIELFKMPKN